MVRISGCENTWMSEEWIQEGWKLGWKGCMMLVEIILPRTIGTVYVIVVGEYDEQQM